MSAPVQPPACADDERRADLLSPSPPVVDLNGIDFVEVDSADHAIVRITFLKPMPPGEYGLTGDPSRIAVAGGTRIVGIRALAAAVEAPVVLRVQLDRGGDYSPYVLTLDAPELDAVKRSVTFSFMASCPTDVDCRPAPCPPEPRDEPVADYLAKDYASFRRLMLDRLTGLNPEWVERNPADLGIALVELFAYVGDQLSYFQDAVANEAYLDTLRTRISARRHARLVDYRMHDGRNAWAPVHVQVTAPTSLPAGTALFTRIDAPLPGQAAPPPTLLPAGAITVEALEREPAFAQVAAFETAHRADLHPENNELRIHRWGDEECCLAAGTTEAYLYAVTDPEAGTAVHPRLAPGDRLVFEEVIGPRTGAAADADRGNRALVLLDAVDDGATDPLYADALDDDGAPRPRESGEPALPLTRVRWRRADALHAPLCLSARLPAGRLLRDVAVARGNIVLADHGLTTAQTADPKELTVDGRLALAHGPLTMATRPELDADVHTAAPAVSLRVLRDTATEDWEAVPDLLDSGPFASHFVAEVDDQGRALLRFGDDEYGRALPDALELIATYRVGNGRAGNVGPETIAHVAPAVADSALALVRNPLGAHGGHDAETIEEVRQLAPQAFHSELFRAVTEADWAEAAMRLPDVAGAAATFRWTGSWTTIFVAIDPRERADLVDLPDGRTRLEPGFERRVRAFLTRFRLAGHDIELRPPRFVPVELAIEVCTRAGHFREDVAQAVRDALSARVLPDGTLGFFHPSHLGFNEPLFVSRLYAAVARVAGVESLAIRRLRRFGEEDAGELERGELDVGPWEIVRLDNDPSFVEHGVLTVTARGGKA